MPNNSSKVCVFVSMINKISTVTSVSETLLHSDNVDLHEVLEYTSIHVTRPSKKEGGVSLCVRSSHGYTVLSETGIITEYMACVFIEVTTRSVLLKNYC